MTESKLMELINKNVLESFRSNEEIVRKKLTEPGRKYYPSTLEGLVDLQGALLDYTMDISQVICAAMSKILFEAGVLDIQSEDK